jgi:hypothetical protein
MSILLGYRLFLALQQQRDSSGSVRLSWNISIALSRVGPGICLIRRGSRRTRPAFGGQLQPFAFGCVGRNGERDHEEHERHRARRHGRRRDARGAVATGESGDSISQYFAVGSEEARSMPLTLASVRRSNWACGFPAPSFHEDAAR